MFVGARGEVRVGDGAGSLAPSGGTTEGGFGISDPVEVCRSQGRRGSARARKRRSGQIRKRKSIEKQETLMLEEIRKGRWALDRGSSLLLVAKREKLEVGRGAGSDQGRCETRSSRGRQMTEVFRGA